MPSTKLLTVRESRVSAPVHCFGMACDVMYNKIDVSTMDAVEAATAVMRIINGWLCLKDGGNFGIYYPGNKNTGNSHAERLPL